MCKLPLLVLALAAILSAQSYLPGPQVLTFFSDVDDSDQPYALYLPRNFNASKRYPLVISLHGAWSNHRLNLKRVFGKGNLPGESDLFAARYFQQFRDVDYIVASPFARGTMGYQGIAEKDVYDVLADVKRRFRIDEDRVYLTGLSMGGGGALWLALTRPDIWAAVAPVCPAAPAGTGELAPNLLNVPVRLFHGDQDPAVPVAVSREWHKRLLGLGSPVEYVEYPGVKHNSWDNAYKDGAIFDWFAGYKRNRYPDRVRFVTRAYKYNRAYWVTIDRLVPGEPSSIDARFTGPNSIEVEASVGVAFTLALKGHPRYQPRRPARVTLNGALHTFPAGAEISFTGGRPGRYTPKDGTKRAGAEGPIAEAVASAHVYVYGTEAAGAGQIRERREMAARAAEWSTPQLKLLLTNRVLSDAEVTADDLKAANLVLFGTKETNSLIARLADRLPLELNAGAADYGLVFIAPVNGRYVLVNSGLPWWTGQEQAPRGGAPYLRGAPYTVLLTLPDYILFKGSLADVVAEGRFDTNWKIPAADRSKLLESGAVVIR